MKSKTLFGLVFLLVLCALSTPAFAGAKLVDVSKHLTPANIAKLEAGETILLDQSYVDENGKTRGKGLAMVMVNATPDQAWAHLVDFDNYVAFMPRLTQSKIYHKGGSKIGVEYVLKVAIVKPKYSCMHTLDKANGMISWTMDLSKENDIAATDGYWKVIEHNGKTILAYTVAAETGRAIPKAIQDYLTKKDLPNVVKAAKKRIESGGTYQK